MISVVAAVVVRLEKAAVGKVGHMVDIPTINPNYQKKQTFREEELADLCLCDWTGDYFHWNYAMLISVAAAVVVRLKKAAVDTVGRILAMKKQMFREVDLCLCD